MDYVQELALVLDRVITSWDPNLGTIATLAKRVFKNKMFDLMALKNGVVSAPSNFGMGKREYIDAIKKLKLEFGRSPGDEEVAKELGWTESRVRGMRGLVSRELSLYRSPFDYQKSHKSVFDPNDADPFRIDYIVGENDPEAKIARIEELEVLMTTGFTEVIPHAHYTPTRLRRLEDREISVLSLYYGLVDDEPKTLLEIGDHMGVSRDRIRTLKEGALGKVRRRPPIKEILGRNKGKTYIFKKV